MVGSATVVKGDLVAIGVGESEGAPEGTVDRGRHDRPTGSDQSVVDGPHVSGVQPDGSSDPGLRNHVKIDARHEIA
jgi:hypothetical protein